MELTTLAAINEMGSAELGAEQEKLIALRDDMFDKSMSEYSKDGEWPTERLNKYAADGEALRQVDALLDHSHKRMEQVHARESVRPKAKQSAVARALHAHMEKGDAKHGLERWEADKFFPSLDRAAVEGSAPGAVLGANTAERMSFCLADDESGPDAFPKFYAAPMQSDTAAGKNVVPRTTSMRVHERLVYFGNVGANVRQINTSTGVPHHELYRDATATRGRVFNAQGKTVQKKDHAEIKHIPFGALDITSDEMPVARRFVTDLSADILGLVRSEGLRSMAAAWNAACVKQPTAPADENLSDVMQGLIGMAAGQSAVIANKAAISHDEIKAWVRRLPYDLRVRNEGNPYGFTEDANMGLLGFMFHSNLFDLICDLDDDDGRPLWQPIPMSSLQSGAAGLIKGYPYRVNNAFDGMGAGASTGDVPGVFMNGDKFTERTVGSIWVNFHFDSRTDQTNSVSYIMWDRRFFAPNNEITAGTGVNDATRSRAVARITLP